MIWLNIDYVKFLKCLIFYWKINSQSWIFPFQIILFDTVFRFCSRSSDWWALSWRWEARGMPIQVSVVLDNNPTKLEVKVRSKVLDLEGGVWAGQGKRSFVPICVCEQCCACLDYPTIVFSTEQEPKKCSMFAKGLVDRPCASCSLSCEHCFPSCKTTFTSHGIEESNLDKGEYFSKLADLPVRCVCCLGLLTFRGENYA